MAACQFDYVVVGGGTAGAIVAARLAEDGSATVCLIEAGPSDEGDSRVLELPNWSSLIGSKLDYDFATEPQERGNSGIRHSRARVLGGCSSHNVCIMFRAPDHDMDEWERAGATGWRSDLTRPYFDRVGARVHTEVSAMKSVLVDAFVEASVEAGLERVVFNRGEVRNAVGFLQLGARGRLRQSSSVCYLHPLRALPPNLEVRVDTPVLRLHVLGNRVMSVQTPAEVISARREVIVCAGVFGSPQLLMLSGIGPRRHLEEMGVKVVRDLPDVGRHLLDHPESVLMYEARKAVPLRSLQQCEAALVASSSEAVEGCDLMVSFTNVAYDMTSASADKGYPTAEHAFCLLPLVTRARSEGLVELRSANPTDPPRIDCRYFTDEEHHDERVLLAGMHLARRIAAQPALADWVKRELAPGEDVQRDADLGEYAREIANTAYHPVGTCRMGAAAESGSVVDPALRVHGIDNLRVADASVFPTNVGVNPVMTCMMIGERCADFVASAARERQA